MQVGRDGVGSSESCPLDIVSDVIMEGTCTLVFGSDIPFQSMYLRELFLGGDLP